MSFFKYIKENILKIKPIFKIKIVETCLDNYYKIKFSHNNGWTWNYILDYEIDSFEPYYHYSIYDKLIYFNNIESFISFHMRNYESCVDFNNNVIESVNYRNKINKESYFEKFKKFKNFTKKINK